MDLGLGVIVPLGGIHDEIGTSSLFFVLLLGDRGPGIG
jgi:hypothetical protein